MATSHDLPIEEVRKLLALDKLARMRRGHEEHKHQFEPVTFGKLTVHRCACGQWRDDD